MFGLGFVEIAVIAVVIVVLFFLWKNRKKKADYSRLNILCLDSDSQK